MSDERLKGWKEIPVGGLIVEPGNSEAYNTGSWRSKRPVIDLDKCIHCLLCWIVCPDSSIVVNDGKVVSIDLLHCKGCGICSKECPPKVAAIRMVDEEEFRHEGE